MTNDFKMVRVRGIEPPRPKSPEPKSSKHPCASMASCALRSGVAA